MSQQGVGKRKSLAKIVMAEIAAAARSAKSGEGAKLTDRHIRAGVYPTHAYEASKREQKPTRKAG